jgi:VCBS repeat-containing protein
VSYTTNLTAPGADAITIVANDQGHTGAGGAQISTQQVAIVVNSVPVITQGPETATVADGGTTFVTGHFSASDAGSNSLTWSVVGGSNVASENYQYGIDKFTVVLNNATIFNDPFNGTAPPTGPASNPNNILYGDSGGTFAAGGGINGGAAIDGSNAAPLGLSLGPSTYDQLVQGQFATLLTPTAFGGPAGAGLRSGQSFSVSAAFDLVTPADNLERYGIRLADRVTGTANGTFDQPGTETVDLSVVYDSTNHTSAVQLTEIDFETGTRTILATIDINASASDNEILLNLSNSASNNGVIQASYTLLQNSGGQEVADGAAHSFGAFTGKIFDNEDWTRAQFYGQAVTTTNAAGTVSVMQGTYGALDVNQNGTWQYYLNPGLASVKALAPGQTAVDTFQIQVTDGNGGHTTQTVNIDVHGRPEVTINVLTTAGLNFTNSDPFAEMGSGQVQTDSSQTGTSFTILDSHDHLKFVLSGTGFTYNGGILTGGTITSFEELTDTGTPLANFTGFSVNAQQWMSAVLADAGSNSGPIDSITHHYDLAFIGNSGSDSFGVTAPPSGFATLTGGGGSDTFSYGQGQGAVTITDFDQGNNPGHFDSTEGDTLVLYGFSGQPNITYTSAAAILDFGNGDVLTLLGITQGNFGSLHIVDNNGGGNNGNGPVITNAGNTVTYSGTPIVIDSSVTLADAAATVTSTNAWISSGEQSGDQLTINGKVDGDFLGSDGSVIHYHFDATLNTNSNQGYGLYLQSVGAITATTADFQVALQLAQFSTTAGDPTVGGTDTSRTITWAAEDSLNHFSSTVTTTVDIVPGLNSMTLAVTRGGTTVLTNGNFSVTDPGFTNFTYSVSNVVGGQFMVFNGTNWVPAPTGGFTTTQIANGQVEFVQDGSPTAPNFSIQVSDGVNVSPAIAPTVNFTDNYAWNVEQYPAVVQGEHIFGVNPQYDAFAGAVVLAYAEMPNYVTTATSLTETRLVESLDPFFLPGKHSAQTVNTTTVDTPARYNFIVPNISVSGTVEPTGIFVYKGQLDSAGTQGNAIWQIVGTPDSNGDGGVTLGSPTEIGNASNTSETNYILTEGFRNNSSGNAQSYDVAWDQFDGSHYQLYLQIAPINQTTGAFGAPVIFSPVIDETGHTSVTVDSAHMPAWQFRSGAGNYVLAISEEDNQTISALNVSGDHDKIHFQNYTNSGGLFGVSFDIQPDLTAYASGATNEIVWQTIPSLSLYPGQTVQAIQFIQVSSANNFNYALAWNETVTVGSATYDQIEFDMLTGNGNNQGSGAVVFHTTFQIADGDPQNLRIGDFVDPFNSSQDDVVIVYGDDSGTHILEYGVTNNGTTVTQLASFTDPTTQAFSNMTVLADGRITITYDDLVNASPDQTSQYLFKTFDLRTTGITINDSSIPFDGQNKYFAGTHFTDTVTGENSVNNEYYFVGQDTTSGGPGPTDHFTGGSGGSDVAIFSDARSDYSIALNGANAATVASNGLDHEHTGSLVVANTQVLAFGPAADPTPHNGIIDVNGGTDVIIGGNNAITIEAGSTAEVDTTGTYSASVTFEAATGTLALDQPGAFTGTIGGITGPGQVLDLAGAGLTASGLDAVHDTLVASTSGGYNGSQANTTTLTVTDTTNNHSITLNLAGDMSTSTWTVTSDGHGGVDIVDPPANGQFIFNQAGTGQNATITNPNVIVASNVSDTLTGNGGFDQFVFKPTTGGQAVEHAITNFDANLDTINLQQFGSGLSAANLIANATQVNNGQDTLIQVDQNDSILLKNVQHTALHTGDFILHP